MQGSGVLEISYQAVPQTGEDGGFHLVNQLPTHEDVDVFSGDPVVVVCVERLSRPRLTRTLQPRLNRLETKPD